MQSTIPRGVVPAARDRRAAPTRLTFVAVVVALAAAPTRPEALVMCPAMEWSAIAIEAPYPDTDVRTLQTFEVPTPEHDHRQTTLEELVRRLHPRAEPRRYADGVGAFHGPTGEIVARYVIPSGKSSSQHRQQSQLFAA